MYKIIDNPKIMTSDDIDKTFDGKWVYIVKANFTPNQSLIDGVPVVVGDAPFEGVEDGIYEQFHKKEYGRRYSHTLLNNENFMSTVFNVR